MKLATELPLKSFNVTTSNRIVMLSFKRLVRSCMSGKELLALMLLLQHLWRVLCVRFVSQGHLILWKGIKGRCSSQSAILRGIPLYFCLQLQGSLDIQHQPGLSWNYSRPGSVRPIGVAINMTVAVRKRICELDSVHLSGGYCIVGWISLHWPGQWGSWHCKAGCANPIQVLNN